MFPRNHHLIGLSLVALTCMFLLPPPVWAQQASGIAGAVRDTSGAVLPGVTVEATSPALIEKVRIAVTDGQGRYNIIDLRPGTYAVTFTLPGFTPFRREGIQLTAGFTATVNAELQVGGLEETITVTGQTPLVDVQNVRQQELVSDEMLNMLPSGSKNLAQTLITLVPGASGTTDVGGSSGLYRSNGQSGGFFYHGKSDVRVLYDGMGTESPFGTAIPYLLNTASAQETSLETGGVSAENNATLVMNLIPKEGGNTFSLHASGTYTGERLQTDNMTDALRARGLTHRNEVLLFYDAQVSVGGPIKRDRLWFFALSRATRNKNTVPGVFFSTTKGTPFYTPDLDRPAYRTEWMRSAGGRVTWQVSERNKVSGFAEAQGFFNRGRGEFASPEAYTHQYNLSPQGLFQISWSSPRSSRLLLEAGASYMMGRWPYPSPGDGIFAAKSPEDVSIVELSTNFRYNARSYYASVTDQYRYAERFSVSYVTGSHALKGGIQLQQLVNNLDWAPQGDMEYAFLRGVPNTLTQHATYTTPSLEMNRATDLGLFVQGQSRVNRLTLNYGLRFDAFDGYVPAQHLAPSRFVPFARDFAPVEDTPAFKDVNPRVGAAYDLFGTGRTAVKVSLGRFVETGAIGLTRANNPINTSVNSARRTWDDTNGNYVPDCDLLNPLANGECGRISDLNFGKNNPRATRYADDVLRGFRNRNFMWDFSTEVEHELRPGVSVSGGYYRNWAGNFRLTDNLAVSPADFDPYCITAPVDPRLPNGGGYEVCGLYDIKPAKFGQVENVVTQASHYYGEAQVTCGGQLEGERAPASGRNCGTSDFFRVSVDTRFGSGIQLGGGVDTGRTVIDNCFVIDSPQQLLNCRTVIGFKNQTQIKVFGNVPLPGDFAVSGTFQSLAGRPFEADYRATNAELARSLGRNLAECGAQAVCRATAAVPLVPPYTMFLDWRNIFHLRLSKSVTVGRARLRGNLDVYNVLNSSAVLGVVNRYGPRWQTPAAQQNLEVDAILPGRMLHLGGQLTF